MNANAVGLRKQWTASARRNTTKCHKLRTCVLAEQSSAQFDVGTVMRTLIKPVSNFFWDFSHSFARSPYRALHAGDLTCRHRTHTTRNGLVQYARGRIARSLAVRQCIQYATYSKQCKDMADDREKYLSSLTLQISLSASKNPGNLQSHQASIGYETNAFVDQWSPYPTIAVCLLCIART
jgi:hypothetical protein